MVIYDISLFKGKLQKKPLHISHLLKYIAFVFLEAFLVAASQSGGHFLIAVSEKIIPQNIMKKYFPMIYQFSASKSQFSRGRYRPDRGRPFIT